MVLTFVDDYSSSTVLDTQLTGVPESGMYFNRGVHPLITIENILRYLSDKTITFSAYAAGTTYGNFMTTRLKSNIVTSGGKIYQSLVSSNTGHDPATSPTYWLETSIESIKLKTEIFNAEDSLIQALNLNRKLVENQYIYNVGTDEKIPNGDYCGWAFEPKNSDYVKIRINQISLQANTTDDVNLYVINQGVLIQTITLHPNNGLLEFEDVSCILTGKGVFYLVFESQSVLSNSTYNDPLKYSGFTCYPVEGTGSTAATSEYKESSPNGLNFNVSVYTDTTVYIQNNLIDFAKLLQCQFELNTLTMFHSNPHVKMSANTRNIEADKLQSYLYNEIKGIEGDTVAKRYNKCLKQAIEALNMTYDNFIKSKSTNKIKLSTI